MRWPTATIAHCTVTIFRPIYVDENSHSISRRGIKFAAGRGFEADGILRSPLQDHGFP